MNRPIAGVLLGISAVQLAFAVAFVFQIRPMIEVWPFAGTTPMSNIFIGSIIGAAAASTAWCVFASSERALAGIALDYVAMLVPFGFLLITGTAGGSGPVFAALAIVCVAGAAFGGLLLRRALTRPWLDPRPMPRLVRAAFAGFIGALVVVGGLLVVKVPNILPWTVTPELSTLFGIMFLGAAAYFTFALVEPRWENAGGQLAGFLAYDIVLIIPFLQRLPTIDDQLRLNLVIYTMVLIVSGGLALWFLVIDARTRLANRRPELLSQNPMV